MKQAIAVLEHNIEYWRATPFTDISNFKGIFQYHNTSNGRERSMPQLYRTIYECMELSDKNLTTLKTYQRLLPYTKLLNIIGPGMIPHDLNSTFKLSTDSVCDFICDSNTKTVFDLLHSYLELNDQRP